MMKTILQSEASECGLACLAMISSFHGHEVDLLELRRKFSVSLKGTKLNQLLRHAASLGLSGRALRLEVGELNQLRLPCVLHWNLDHFVVLTRIRRSLWGGVTLTVLDPAVGERSLSLEKLSESFTGVALELMPSDAFERKEAAPKIALRELTGKIYGLRSAVAKIIALALALEVFAIVSPLFSQYVLDDVIVSGDRNLLKVLAIGFALMMVTQTLIELARSWFIMRWGMEVSTQWSTRVLRHLVRLPSAYFEKRHLGDIVSRFGSVNAIQGTLTSLVLESALDGIMAIATFIMMYMYSKDLIIIVLVANGLYCVLRMLAYQPLRDASLERLILSAKEGSYFLETLRAITPVKLFGRETERVSRWLNLRESVNNRDMKTQKLGILFKVSASFISGTRAILVLYVGANLVMSNAMTIGMLMAFSSYATTFSGRFLSLVDVFVSVKMLGMHTERLSDVVLEPAEDAGPALPESDLGNLSPSVELRNVKFRYADGEPWVLNGINLQIQAGEHLAIAGPSGCGKTTLCKILLGLLRPTEGEVLVGGVPLDQVGMQNFRRVVGSVMQEDTLMAGSILDNISFFEGGMCQAEVEAAARLAAIHDEISQMPMGYHTLVGDMGSSLSGGQKQRVLLARALYKQPMILALDEATSHLDVENERLVTAALAELQLTRVVVAHRPQTIASADNVVFLYGGLIQEAGKLAQKAA